MREHEDEIHAARFPCCTRHKLLLHIRQGSRKLILGMLGTMNWKTDFRSIYYDGAPEPADLVLPWAETALLIIDVQNTYLARPDRAALPPEDQRRYDAWTPFHRRLTQIVIPNTQRLLGLFRGSGIECLFARIACHTKDGRDRSLSQRKPGWNNLLLPKDEPPSQLVPELTPRGDEITVTKTTDSALTGTNLRLILHNLGIRNVVCAGIFTDQCVSSTVRSLADESFNVVVVEDCCAAGSHELHLKELEIINMIYCHVLSSQELIHMIKLEDESAFAK
jgi:biuret amidohydrolase